MSIIPWPDKDKIDNETWSLMNIVNTGWDWEFPGWNWVAERLNEEFGNSRSASACRHKYNSLMKFKK